MIAGIMTVLLDKAGAGRSALTFKSEGLVTAEDDFKLGFNFVSGSPF